MLKPASELITSRDRTFYHLYEEIGRKIQYACEQGDRHLECGVAYLRDDIKHELLRLGYTIEMYTIKKHHAYMASLFDFPIYKISW